VSFQKHSWLKYGRRGMKCEIQVFDEDNKKLDFFKFPVSDKQATRNVSLILKRSYGINFTPEIKTDDSINIKKIMKDDLLIF